MTLSRVDEHHNAWMHWIVAAKGYEFVLRYLAASSNISNKEVISRVEEINKSWGRHLVVALKTNIPTEEM